METYNSFKVKHKFDSSSLFIMGFGLFILYNNTYKPYFQLEMFLFGIPIFLIGFLIFLEYFFRNNIEFFDKEIVITGHKENTIECVNLSEIISFAYYTTKTKHSTQNNIDIYFKSDRITLCEESITNLEEIKNFLISKKITEVSEQYKSYKRKNIESKFSNWVFALIFLIISIIGFAIYSGHVRSNDRKEKIEIYLPILEKAKYQKSKGRGSYDLKLTRIPNQDFHINSYPIKILENLEVNDSILVEISKHDFEVKIQKTLNPNFFDKHFSWNEIEVSNINYIDQHLYPTE